MTTFANLVIAGHAHETDIDDWIDAWNEAETDIELHETLGLTFDQYRLWVSQHQSFSSLIGIKQADKPEIDRRRLTIKHGIDPDDQTSSFMNATFEEGHSHAVSIALTLPEEYDAMHDQEFEQKFAEETLELRKKGWTFEIQRGQSEIARSRNFERFTKLLEDRS